MPLVRKRSNATQGVGVIAAVMAEGKGARSGLILQRFADRSLPTYPHPATDPAEAITSCAWLAGEQPERDVAPTNP